MFVFKTPTTAIMIKNILNTICTFQSILPKIPPHEQGINDPFKSRIIYVVNKDNKIIEKKLDIEGDY